MNLKKLTDEQLHEIINNTSDLKLLSQAESEYLDRLDPDDSTLIQEFDCWDSIETEIAKIWRPS